MEPAEVRAFLGRVGGLPDDAIDLGETALALAALDRPRVALDRYRDHLDRLARDVAAAADDGEASTVEGRVAALNSVLFDDHGYRGDELTYEDLQNANLMRVIDRRKGLPVALGILYIHAARAQGWDAAGLAFPGHFLIALAAGDARAVVDPFAGGRTCTAADMRALLQTVGGPEAALEPRFYAPVGNRDVLLRLQNNIKLRLVRQQRFERARDVAVAMTLFAPEAAAPWRAVGMIEARLGNFRAAQEALERFLALTPSEHERHEAAAFLQRLHRVIR